MRVENFNSEPPPIGIIAAIEESMAYFNDEPNDGRFNEVATKTAEEFWQNLDMAALAEAIISKFTREELTVLAGQTDILKELLNQAIQDAWRTSVDKMMSTGVSADRQEYLEEIKSKAKV
jgi:hypothetical protein